jgi:hypothetical protein
LHIGQYARRRRGPRRPPGAFGLQTGKALLPAFGKDANTDEL